MIETITFKEKQYPVFQSQGFAAQFAFPFAKKILKGNNGYDIGCNRPEWAFPGAMLIDPAIDPTYNAMNLPALNVDWIFSSHCLEHLNDWVGVLDYWETKLNPGGVLFLYLPHPSQYYWLPWHNRKHVNVLSPEIIEMYLKDRGWKNIFVSSYDLNNSFYAVAETPC